MVRLYQLQKSLGIHYTVFEVVKCRSVANLTIATDNAIGIFVLLELTGIYLHAGSAVAFASFATGAYN